MAEKAELDIVIKAYDEASQTLGKAGDQVSSFQKTFSVAKAAIGTASGAMVGFMSDIAREGAADAASLDTLRVAAENAGTSWEDVSDSTSRFIDMMRDTRSIADDKLKPALAGLIATTGSYERSVELAGLAADVARGKHMDLSSASELIGKVAMGNVSMLTRYGIVLGENATAEEALAELQKRFAGQAEAYGQTTAGQMETLSLRIGDFREELGQALGPAMGWIGMLPGMQSGIMMVSGALGGFIPLLGGVSKALMTSVIPSIIATTIAMGPILIPIIAIGAAIGLLALAWSQNWGDIQGKTEAVLGVLRGWFDGFSTFMGGFWEGLKQTAKDAVNFVIDLVNTFIEVWTTPYRLLQMIPGMPDLPDIPMIPHLAKGGIITQPTLAMLGEGGPEMVSPLSRYPQGINVTVNVYGTVIAERDLAVTVREELLKMSGRMVSSGLGLA